MQRLPKSTLMFWLFIGAFVGIVAFLVIGIALDLAQVSITLLFIFLDNNSINASYGGIVGGLALLASLIQTKILLGRSTQSLAYLVSLSTSTIFISGSIVFFCLGVLFVLRFFILQWFMAIKPASITFLR